MHKYQPRVHIIKKPDQWDGTCDKMISSHKYTRTFSFQETIFIAVTAYQNQLVRHSLLLFKLLGSKISWIQNPLLVIKFYFSKLKTLNL